MKKTIKKICVLLGCLSMAFEVTGCGDSAKTNEVGQQQVTETDENNKQESVISFSGKDMEGKEVNSADIFAGHKITMVNVWATFCNPCIQELPDLEQLNKEIEADGMQVIGLVSDVVYSDGNYNEDNWKLGETILKEKGVTYTNIMCDVSAFQDQIRIDAVPTTFFVDENGKMVGQTQIGSVSKEDYKKLAQEALQEAEQ